MTRNLNLVVNVSASRFLPLMPGLMSFNVHVGCLLHDIVYLWASVALRWVGTSSSPGCQSTSKWCLYLSNIIVAQSCGLFLLWYIGLVWQRVSGLVLVPSLHCILSLASLWRSFPIHVQSVKKTLPFPFYSNRCVTDVPFVAFRSKCKRDCQLIATLVSCLCAG